MQKIDKIKYLIEKYKLTSHIEGGYFKRHYESNEIITRENNCSIKAGSAIYYLLEKNQISQFHSISSDELWHYYDGGVLEVHIIDNNKNYHIKYLGNSHIYNDAAFCIPIERGSIFAAKVLHGDYVFAGCSLHPEFIMEEFTLYDKDELVNIYPYHKEVIENFLK